MKLPKVAAGTPKAFFAKSPFAFLDSGDSARVIASIREGLPAQAIDFLAERLSLARATLLQTIKIPLSTIERRMRTGESLSAEESDRVSRVAKVLYRAMTVLGDETQATAWMRSAVTSLGGHTPLSLLDTMEGYELVTNTLSRIEFGVYG